MKKLFLFCCFAVLLFSKEVLWIYTDIACDKPIDVIKKEYQELYPSMKVKVLKAPYKILIKKMLTQKKADIFITDKVKEIYKYPELFDIYYKRIGIKKLALISKNEVKLEDIKNKRLKVGVVKRVYELFADVLKKYKDEKFFLEVKIFYIKKIYDKSAQCARDLLKNNIDVCVDWIGTGVWKQYRDKFNYSLINSELYKQDYVYVVVTKISNKKILAKKFINFAEIRFKMIGKKRGDFKTLNFLSPDLPL